MRLFELHRDVDASGVSGTGVVAQGVEFDNGQCCMTWLTEWNSVAVYPDIATLEAIHGHNGNTRVVWIEGPAPERYLEISGNKVPIHSVDRFSENR
ncbi:hypothetical protein SEA_MULCHMANSION_116 [Streptomyces phage MulchMansion]|nr:hypothetical protein SEA_MULCHMANSION_116 [Streptomyces phage MulchMansion]UVK61203.1 hypothetical protein SEA_ANGELA_116 [Streptomyces phage Angela]